MRYTTLFIFLSIPFLFACTKEKDQIDPVVPVTPTDTVKNEFLERTLWIIPNSADTSWVPIGEVVIASDKIICVRQKVGYENIIFAADINTGKILWEWGDPYIGEGYFVSRIHLHEDSKLIVETWSDLFIIDTNTGKTIWSNIVKGTGICGSPRSTLINDHIYYLLTECGPASTYNFLMRTPVSHFAPDTLFKIYMSTAPGKDSAWISNMEPPYLWLNENGDSTLIFQDRAIRLGINTDKGDLYSYSLKNRSLNWKIDSIFPEGLSSSRTPIIDDHFIYLQGQRSYRKVDLKDGKTIWSRNFNFPKEDLFSCTALNAGDKILVQPGSTTLYALDKATGNSLWEIKNVGQTGPEGNLALYENKVAYIAAPYLYEIDHAAGKVITSNLSPNKYRGYPVMFYQYAETFRVPEKKYFFTSDERFCMLVEYK